MSDGKFSLRNIVSYNGKTLFDSKLSTPPEKVPFMVLKIHLDKTSAGEYCYEIGQWDLDKDEEPRELGGISYKVQESALDLWKE